MLSCPKCKSHLQGIDTLGIIAFEKGMLRVIWLVVTCFLVFLWSVLVLILVPESIRSGIFIMYYLLSGAFVYKLYKKKLNSVIYECDGCKARFKGPDLTEFEYKAWNRDENNKNFKKDVL